MSGKKGRDEIRKLKAEFDRWLPPPKTETERRRDRTEFTGLFVFSIVDSAHAYRDRRRGGERDPGTDQLSSTQKLGLALSYHPFDPPESVKAAARGVLYEEPDNLMGEALTAKSNALMAEVIRLSLERLNAELEGQC
jgi:hypothetical protein